ncbi:TetR/AcrR family transcriptional regulator [Kribbella sp. NPDC051587]|uniref:TetR/AcrR family transcriptional regulator n=1 Tax=Kribbella sp. NPDC051587 TaxID=3364119 RepID=UPI0037A0E44A
MIEAARSLIRERGLNATAIADVLERSGAPRGSVYFHFPGGKAQLATEAAAAHAHDQVRMIDEFAAESSSAAEFIERYVDAGRDGMLDSGFGRGCGLAPLVTEGPHDVEDLAETGRQGFTEMVDRVAFHFVAFGIGRTAARSLADAVIAGMEGAMITSRAFRSPSAWDSMKQSLLAYEKSVR